MATSQIAHRSGAPGRFRSALRRPLVLVAVTVAVALAGAWLLFDFTARGPRYEDPRAVVELVREAGFPCELGPGIAVSPYSDPGLATCFLNGQETEESLVAVYTYDDASEVDSQIRVTEDLGFLENERVETWIVGENWIVQVSASLPASDVERMSEALEGEIVEF